MVDVVWKKAGGGGVKGWGPRVGPRVDKDTGRLRVLNVAARTCWCVRTVREGNCRRKIRRMRRVDTGEKDPMAGRDALLQLHTKI